MLFKSAIKSGLRKIKYIFAKNRYVKFDASSVEDALHRLYDIYPDPMNTCYGENSFNPNYDLQIIVPAYNVEKFIYECMESIVLLAQNDCSFCVTVVNDGSTDRTIEILNNYRKYPFIEIITQNNRGLSGARNTALKNIKGKYILFVDSDDTIDACNVAKLLRIANTTNCDMIIGDYTIVRNGRVYKSHNSYNSVSRIVSNCHGANGYAWGKLIKGELFKNLIFPECYYFEDIIISHILFDMVKSIYIAKDICYNYRKHDGSITATHGGKIKSMDALYVFNRVLQDRSKFLLIERPLNSQLFLSECVLCFTRVLLLNEAIKRDVFIVLCGLYHKYCNTPPPPPLYRQKQKNN